MDKLDGTLFPLLQANSNRAGVQQNRKSQSSTDKKVKEMKDQLVRAKAYLNFAPPSSNSHFVKELKLRIKELERAMGDAKKDSDLSRRFKCPDPCHV